MMEAVSTSEISVNCYEITGGGIPEDRHVLGGRSDLVGTDIRFVQIRVVRV
jgi:hypothetical protein